MLFLQVHRNNHVSHPSQFLFWEIEIECFLTCLRLATHLEILRLILSSICTWNLSKKSGRASPNSNHVWYIWLMIDLPLTWYLPKKEWENIIYQILRASIAETKTRQKEHRPYIFFYIVFHCTTEHAPSDNVNCPPCVFLRVSERSWVTVKSFL